MTENQNEDVQLSEQDIADLETMANEESTPTERSLLEIWDHVFSNVANVRAQPIDMGVAQKLVSQWPKLSYQDTARYHEVYHDYLTRLGAFLAEIPAERRKHVGEADLEENSETYVNLLVSWHVALDEIKESWDARDPESHIQAAALTDAGGFVFSQVGLLGHLAAIGFQLDEQVFMGLVQKAKEA